MKPIGITMGETAGISGEITLKTWQRVKNAGVPLVAFDNVERLNNLSKKFNIKSVVTQVNHPKDALNVFKDALPVYNVDLPQPPTPGSINNINTKSTIASIGLGASFAKAGLISALVTNPIHKKTLYEAGFNHRGHTEYLADVSGNTCEPAMMLACSGLRTIPITTHLSLQDAILGLSTEKIVSQSRIAAAALREDFGINKPRLAIAGLNPHAGEDGAMGKEEQSIIKPAISILRKDGIEATGPVPPDSMFTLANRASYDAAICMYHDQALIPVKTLDFSGGVNITLGLTFIRTSPDHGSALDIANKGIADETSMVTAFNTAVKIAKNRGFLSK